MGASLALACALAAAPNAAALAAGTPAPAPAASTSIATPAVDTFGIGPATNGKVDRRANFDFVQARTGVISDQIALVNLSQHALRLNLYAATIRNAADGSLALDPRLAKPTDVATWVTFHTPGEKPFVVVPARTTVIVNFTIQVPPEAYIGDHLAGVVASVVSESQANGSHAANLKLEQRIAIRLAIRVAGAIQGQLTVDNLKAHFVGTVNPFGTGAAVVTYRVRNSGNVRLGGQQQVVLHSLVGLSYPAAAVADLPMLLPGGSAVVSVTVTGVPALVHLTAQVQVTPVVPAGDADPSAATARAAVGIWAVPWSDGGLLLLLFLVVMYLRSIRGARPVPNHGRRGKSAEGESDKSSDLVSAGPRRHGR